MDNGFSDLEVTPAEQGDTYKWNNLYGIRAYSALQEIAETGYEYTQKQIETWDKKGRLGLQN